MDVEVPVQNGPKPASRLHPSQILRRVSSIASRRRNVALTGVLDPAPFGTSLSFGLVGRVTVKRSTSQAPEQDEQLDGQLRRVGRFRLELVKVILDPERSSSDEERAELIRRVKSLVNISLQNLELLLGTCVILQQRYLVRAASERQPVRDFFGAHPTIRRDTLILDVARALAHLHSKDIVHGDVNIEHVSTAQGRFFVLGGLVQQRVPDKRPTDVALLPPWAKLRGNEPAPWPNVNDDSTQDNPQWIAPRGYDHDPKDLMTEADLVQARDFLCSSSTNDDLWAFGFLALAVFTDFNSPPKAAMSRVLRAVLNRGQPLRPRTVAELHGLDEFNWQIMMRCWRMILPKIDAKILLSTLQERRPDPARINCPVDWRTSDLQAWAKENIATLDISDVREVKDGRDIENTIQEVQAQWKKSNGPPQTVKLIDPRACRPLDLWQEAYFLSHAFIWHQLTHTHVLPLLGMCYMQSITANAFIVPWMEGGSATDYLAANPEADRFKLVVQVAQALQFFHSRSPPVIHHDVRPHTVYMSQDGTAYLAHFDFAPYYKPSRPYTFDGVTSLHGAPYRPGDKLISPAIDVYHFGMLCYELFTGLVPFAGEEEPVYQLVRRNRRPPRPTSPALPDDLWNLITHCWRRDPFRRPPMERVLVKLQDIQTASAAASTTTAAAAAATSS